MFFTQQIDYFTKQYLETYETQPKEIKKKLDILSKKLNLLDKGLFFKGYDGEIREGDIFVVQVQKGCYIYGKVLSTSVNIMDKDNQRKPDYVILFYKIATNDVKMPDKPLDLNNLLMRPYLTIGYFFNSGFAKVIGNIPLSEEERNFDIGFLYGCSVTSSKFDEETKEMKTTKKEIKDYCNIEGDKINYVPKYYGSTKSEGLGIIYDIARALIMNPDVLDDGYVIEEKKKLKRKKKTIKINKEISSIEEIVNLMKEFHEFNETLNRNIKKNIESFRLCSYEFDFNARAWKTKEDFLKIVKEYVVELNNLNEDSDYQLIETNG
ncbi:hypothetical protein KHQ81_00025 [Mycoplasmatota bacterium]|nr:hypothetical protein KHQ81_00025 [Mycoplasmatota bacterium]